MDHEEREYVWTAYAVMVLDETQDRTNRLQIRSNPWRMETAGKRVGARHDHVQ